VELTTASWSVPIDTQGTARQEFCLDRNGSEPRLSEGDATEF